MADPRGFVTALAIFICLLWIAPAALAAGGLIAADKAHEQAQSGELTIVDVRSPAEWRETGIAAGARLATIHNRKGPMGFLEEMIALVEGDKSKPVAMICARGARSAAATAFLRGPGGPWGLCGGRRAPAAAPRPASARSRKNRCAD